MSQGYIKLHRRLLRSKVFTDAGLLRFWIWCLLKASYEPETVEIRVGRGKATVELQPGQFVFGRKSAGKELGVPPNTVRRYLERLVDLGQVEVDNRVVVGTFVSVVTVVNWPTYQGHPEKGGPLVGTFEPEKMGTFTEPEMAAIPVASGPANCQPGHLQAVHRGHPRNIYKEKNIPPKPAAPGDALRLADLLAALILANNPKNVQLRDGKRPKTAGRWAVDIDKLHRIDGQDWGDIEKVIRWCQADDFWSKNVLSGATLRKQWDRLILQATEKSPKAKDWRDAYKEL